MGLTQATLAELRTWLASHGYRTTPARTSANGKGRR